MYRLIFLSLLLASCASPSPVNLYSLDVPVGSGHAGHRLPVTIAVAKPAVQPGYDTAMMAYSTRTHEIGYFSKNQWVASPDRMLFPILAETLSRRFETVLKAPAAADMRLDTDIVMLRQEFSGNSSRIHLVLRAQIRRDGKTVSRAFEIFEPCKENDPYGGVVAANRAVSRLVREIADFCVAEAKPH